MEKHYLRHAFFLAMKLSVRLSDTLPPNLTSLVLTKTMTGVGNDRI